MGHLDANCFSKTVVSLQTFLEQVPLHSIDRADLDSLLSELLQVCSKRFVASLDDRFQRCLSFWMSSGSSEISGELSFKVLIGIHGLWGKTLVPRHNTLPHVHGKQTALDRAPNILVFKHRFDVNNVIVRVCRAIIRCQGRWIFHPFGEPVLHYHSRKWTTGGCLRLFALASGMRMIRLEGSYDGEVGFLADYLSYMQLYFSSKRANVAPFEEEYAHASLWLREVAFPNGGDN